jgi:hypothetical protein
MRSESVGVEVRREMMIARRVQAGR